MAATAFASAPSNLPEAEQPEFVRATIAAVAKRDAAFLDRLYPSMEEVTGDSSHPIGSGEALDLLAGCEAGIVKSFDGSFYTAEYRCPKRRAEATGCDSGDLFLIMSRTLAVAHRRRVSDQCPLFVPG